MQQIGNRQAVIRQNIGGARRAGGAAGLGQARPAQAPAPGPANPGVAPQGTPMPWDLAASQGENNAQRNYGNTLAQIGSNWALTQQEYGLEGPYADASSNPYSKAALLQRSYDNARRGTTNSAGLQLYAGSTVNAQNANTFHYNEGYDSLQKGFARAGAEKISAEQAAQERLQSAAEEANWRRIEAGLQAEPEAAAAPAPGGGGSHATLGKRGRQIKYGIAKGHKAR